MNTSLGVDVATEILIEVPALCWSSSVFTNQGTPLPVNRTPCGSKYVRNQLRIIQLLSLRAVRRWNCPRVLAPEKKKNRPSYDSDRRLANESTMKPFYQLAQKLDTILTTSSWWLDSTNWRHLWKKLKQIQEPQEIHTQRLFLLPITEIKL